MSKRNSEEQPLKDYVNNNNVKNDDTEKNDSKIDDEKNMEKSNEKSSEPIKNIVQEENNEITTYIPSKDPDKFIDIRDKEIWCGFPLIERLLYAATCRTKCYGDYRNGDWISNKCCDEECSIDPNLRDLENKIVKFSIYRTGILEINKNIIHPYVRISIINLKTGRYLQKSNFKSPCISRYESNLIVKQNSSLSRTEFQKSILDIVAPFYTMPYDLREKEKVSLNGMKIFI